MSFAETFKALSDPVRREILILLKDGDKKSAGEISSNFNLTDATISHHLSVLKKSNLIKQSRKKNFLYYEINTSVFEEVMIWFAQFSKINKELKEK